MLQNTKGFHLIAAITFCLLALADLAFLLRFSTLGAVLMLLGYILVVVPLFLGRRSAVTALGFLLMAAVPFATFLRYIAYGMSFVSIFQQLIPLLSSVCAALFAFALCVCQQKSYANGHEKVVQCQHGQVFLRGKNCVQKCEGSGAQERKKYDIKRAQ